MRQKRQDTHFRGVFHDTRFPGRPYRAWIKTNGRLVSLGHFANETHAVLAADLARYLCWGPDPTKWYNENRQRMSAPPNYGPTKNLPFDRQIIIAKLLANRVVDPMTLADNLTAYDDIAAKLAATT